MQGDQNRKIQERLGFRIGDRGTHSSRTIMLAELRLLLDSLPQDGQKSDYLDAVTRNNILGKRTVSTRKYSAKRLSELYGLDSGIPLFRAMRFFWTAGKEGRPLLAFLCAFARDPLLRFTAPAILPLKPGETVTTRKIEAVLAPSVEGRFNQSILNKVARNAASSWTQSGHLVGRVHKVRSHPEATPANAAFAIFIGYLEGKRAQRLFDTVWVKLLDRPVEEIAHLAADASRQGLLVYKNVGGVIEILFPDLLTKEEQELIREQG
ncbi:MAG: hypothetical protein ABSA04_07555 [Desulfobaccales bacterium]|jgi:hypothetical protein